MDSTLENYTTSNVSVWTKWTKQEKRFERRHSKKDSQNGQERIWQKQNRKITERIIVTIIDNWRKENQ